MENPVRLKSTGFQLRVHYQGNHTKTLHLLDYTTALESNKTLWELCRKRLDN
jgi:hypothetical protein